MKTVTGRPPAASALALVLAAAGVAILMLGAIRLWAIRGNAILLDLTFTGCF